MGNIWRAINVANGNKHESMPCKPCSPIYAYASRRMRVCYCRLNISIKELALSYFSGDVSDMIMIRHICALYNPNVLVYIHVTVIIVMIWLMYKEIVKPPAPTFRSLNRVSYVLWLCVLLEIKLTTTLWIWTFTGGSVAVLSRWLSYFSNSEQKPWSKAIRCHIYKEYHNR